MRAKPILGFHLSLSTCACLLYATIAQGSNTAAGPILWVNDANGTLGTVDMATGDVTVVGATGVVLTDIAFDPEGELWGISFTNLYRINKDTGAASWVGPTGVQDGNSLVFGSDGTLYSGGRSTTQLNTIDTTSGNATSIGDVGFRSAGDLAFNSGDLYMSSVSNILVKIAIEPTVSGTGIGPIGFVNVFGMATADHETLYGISETQVFAMDVSTGQGTGILDYSGQGLFAANGTAFVSESVPEPSSLALLIMGSSACFRRRPRKR